MLILLDIDGVMVPANSWKKPEFHEDGFPMFNSRSVSALQKIISETGASLLLTTSHKSKYNLNSTFNAHNIFNAVDIDFFCRYIIHRLPVQEILFIDSMVSLVSGNTPDHAVKVIIYSKP